MKVKLICSESTKSELVELMSYKNIDIVENSDVAIVESGFPIPDDAVTIIFKKGNVVTMLDFLDSVFKRNDNSTIIGRKSDDNLEIIPYKEVLYFEGKGNNAYCVTLSGEYRIKEKLYELEKKLINSQFIRVGKSFIVNISNVKEIIPWFGRRLILRFVDNKGEVEVSRNYVKSFKAHLGI